MRKIYQFYDPVRMVEAKYGNMLYNQYCHWVGKALELYGEYCEHEMDLFRQILKPTDNVWEIGANTGSQSVGLAKMIPNGEFVGFEPQIEIYKIFCSNLTLNNCENARAMNIALGDSETTTNGVVNNNTFGGGGQFIKTILLPKMNYHAPNNFGGVSLLTDEKVSTSSGQQSNIAVEIHSVDSLHYLPSPNFIKMDVEGMEAMVLNGARKTLAKTAPIMYIENDRIDKSKNLIELLWELEYDCYWHITPYYNPKNYFQNKHNIYGNTASFNMLCIPRSKGNINIQGMPKITDANYHPLRR